MPTIVLIEPKIPQNTGTIGRVAAAYNCPLHIVGNIGFSLSDSALKRAGLDYWPFLDWTYYPSLDDYLLFLAQKRFFLLSAHGQTPYTKVEFKADDYLVFGCETQGLPKALIHQYQDQTITIPMLNPNIRSLNLSNAVSIILLHALHHQF